MKISILLYLAILGVVVFKRAGDVLVPSSDTFFVLYEDGYWKVNRDGWLVGVASEDDILKHAVVSGVDVEGLRVSEKDLEILRSLRMLNDPYVSLLNVKGRYVITVKGMVLYFREWKDLEKYFEKFKEKMKYFSPGSVFYLYEGGRLVILRGD